MRYFLLAATLVSLGIVACAGQAKQSAGVKPAASNFTQVHHGAFSVVTATVTCPPTFPTVTGGGGQGGGGPLVLSEPTTGNAGWTVSGSPSASVATQAWAVCTSL
jgi:hypothetical protein